MVRSMSISRRSVLVAGLSLGFAVTTSGTTALRAFAAEGESSIDVMGDYTIRNSRTGCRVSVKVRNGVRTIASNGIPDFTPGTFPNPNCPNAISTQSYSYRFSTKPKRTAITAFAIPQSFGISVDGVLFDPYAAEYWNNDRNSGWQYYALGGGIDLGMDVNHAHVQPTGAYHYHGIPDGLLDVLGDSGHSPLVGWAGDGFPIYVRSGYSNPRKAGKVRTMRSSYRLKSGTRPSGPGGTYNGWFNQDYEYVAGSGDLDAANGRYCVTPEYPKGTYAYFLTEEFPSVPNAFAGSIASSFVVTPGAGGGGGTGQPPGGPGGGAPPGGAPPGGGPPPRP
jgi:hypothetical protein